ncbi:hypothetical protein Pfo_027305 [Paulownia fortunei]|nr:hypothetical protein Pfo_027305 [Paulownia fortunei]
MPEPWVELRLLLNEQAVNEKMMENDISLTDAIRSLSPLPGKSAASDNESNFIQIILTRLLVRPDAAPLFSEAAHLLGQSLEDSMPSQVKWLLSGTEVLYGKKSIQQKVMNIAADLKDLSLKPQYWKPWGWGPADINAVPNKGEKWKSEAGALEEGEVVDEGTEFNQFGKGYSLLDVEGFIVSQQHLTDRALIDLILQCVDQGSDDLRNNFAKSALFDFLFSFNLITYMGHVLLCSNDFKFYISHSQRKRPPLLHCDKKSELDAKAMKEEIRRVEEEEEQAMREDLGLPPKRAAKSQGTKIKNEDDMMMQSYLLIMFLALLRRALSFGRINFAFPTSLILIMRISNRIIYTCLAFRTKSSSKRKKKKKKVSLKGFPPLVDFFKLKIDVWALINPGLAVMELLETIFLFIVMMGRM